MSGGNDILEMYIYETNTLLEQLEAIVLDAEKVETFSQDSVNEIFRIMHTVKGSSAMMEFDTLATIAHRIEDMFFIIRENSMDVVSDAQRSVLFDVLFQSIDYFRGEVEKIEAEQPLDKNIDSFLANINSLIAEISGSKAETPAAAAPGAAAGTKTVVIPGTQDFPYELCARFDEGVGMENLRSFMIVTSVREVCDENEFIFYPADVETNSDTADFITENGFYLLFKSPQDRENAHEVVATVGSVVSCQTYDHPAFVEEPVKVESSAGTIAVSAADGADTGVKAGMDAAQQPREAKESLISVSLSKLDQLAAVVGEIVITESMVTASPDLKGLALDNFAKSARQLRKLTDELQDVSMSLRMVPISSVFQKMNRIVRDMSKKLGKKARLTLVGENTEVDKTIIDNIGDPIMHMVRNSMDHGLEVSEEDRIAAGKDPEGEIILSARDTGSEVIIEIRDDGRGVDYDNVLKKAVKNGLASPDMDYSEKEILNFLLMPGFSTNAEATEFSGRGVGMDVVKRNIEEIGGTVTISSKFGKGMTTVMKIPLTMAIMDGMEVSVGKSIFTIPINNIRQSFRVSAEELIHDSTNGEVVKCIDNFYPVVRAKNLFGLQDGEDDIENGILLWLESADYSYCLFVDELLGEQQVVVKQLPSYINSYNIKSYGINGCTLLGDGSISIILDVGSLYTAAYGGGGIYF